MQRNNISKANNYSLKKIFLLLFLLNNLLAISQPTIGFLDAFEDATLAKARNGFVDALRRNGYSEKNKTIKIIYRNAQGDIPTLTQATDYFISQNVQLIATCPSLSTITAIKRTTEIPVCMLVSPSPQLAGLLVNGKAPANLFGAYETLNYIDTSLSLILDVLPNAKKVGLLYNQSEPQSVSALAQIKNTCKKLNLELVYLPANNSSETQQVVQTLIAKNIDAFFAIPDNTVFASFEVISKECKKAGIPVFTSEAGLYERGADVAFGADMYQWGFQAGLQAAQFLKTGTIPTLEIVKVRNKLIRNNIFKTEKKQNQQHSNFYISALVFALAFCGLCLGLYLSINVFNLPDITTDGSFTLGAAISAICILNNQNIFVTILLVLISGALAGLCTAFIHTKLKVNALLSGIITMTALYSVNLIIMGRSNIPLNLSGNYLLIVQQPFFAFCAVAIILVLALAYILKTDFGIVMRATGSNPKMLSANGVNTNKIKHIGLAIANALTALSGFLVTLYQGFADINMGIGIVVFGLGSVMISSAILDLLKINTLFVRLVGVIIGAIIFRLILAFALSIGSDPVLLKLITAAVVLLVVSLPAFKKEH